ncbi:M23 family metallopeptidase [Pseudactinotalea terrae]|uniref:M23 family metallopeptidase n=1 Tax=Pseudactinotalea terrae TaxID=1743262 RepID=UPI0012E2E78B
MSDVPTPRRRTGDDPGPSTPPQPARAPRTETSSPAAGQVAPPPAHRARNAAATGATTAGAAASLAGKKTLGGAATAAATLTDPNATKGEKAQAAVAGGLEVAATAAATAVATPVAGKVAGAVVGKVARSRTGQRAFKFFAGGALLTLLTVIVIWSVTLTQLAGALVDEDEHSRTVPSDQDQCSANLAPPPADAPADLLTDEQWDNARVIVQVGQDRQLPEYAYVVAIATAMQESGLRNIDYGDRDSVGLFQQRTSQGWGTVDQIMDPVYSSGKFYDVLVTVTGWEQMPVTVAAQKVQRSGFPDAYAKHETKARQIVSAITGGPTVGGCTDASFECVPLEPNTVEQGLTPDALNFARCAAAQFGIATGNILGVGNRAANPKSDHPNGRAIDLMVPDWRTTSTTGDEWAQFAIDNAAAFGVKYVIWDARVWLASTGQWEAYSHPSGATDPTNMHLDHVHVSVHGTAGTGYNPDGGDPGGDVVGGWAFPMDPGAKLTSPFGPRTHPVTGELGKMHAGIDLAAPTGAPVYAAAAGTVTKVGLWGTGGQTIFVDHGNGLITHYLHLSQYQTTVGQQVQAGELIGLVGATGRVTGPHLHFEVEINGSVVDPVPFLQARGVM